ncbi:uncharacterized protein LOC141831656 [Curcuma longa]|uniref:uncharacterized protein LOC141831656 n=1 Tax=Curcuma longa TaxID=136217 RepID=UPI003D9EB6F9
MGDHAVDEEEQQLFDSDSNSDEEDAKMSQKNGPLYELSTLMEQLPIKRGLSKYYPGKSQSYASLSVVRALEDLPKKESSYKRKVAKACECYEGVEKVPRVASCASLVTQSSSKKPPLVPAQK